MASALAAFVGIGVAAWAFGVNSSSGTTAACEAAPTVVVVPDKVPVNVFNSTPQTGLAEQAAKELKAKGFKIGDVGNDKLRRKIRGTGELRYGPNGERQVAALQAWQPGMVLVNDKRSGPVVDFVLGYKYEKLNDTPTAPVSAVTTCGPSTDKKPTTS